jgi:uncharacterized protein (TIGR03437 family)
MAAVVLLAALALAQSSGSGPYYTADSIANSAANVTGLYAPNTFVTIYGQNLAYTTRALLAGDIAGHTLPTVLGTTGVRVLINSIPADIYYVSPTQVNLLIPTSLTPGPVILQLVVDSYAGPAIPILLQSAAPSLFQLDAVTVLGVHLDGTTITPASPAQAGEVVVLFASGLGPTNPAAVPNEIPQQAASVTPMSSFQMLINGAPVDPQQILYAGVVPTFAGLFQINVQLPAMTPSNPQIQIGYAGIMSPSGRVLPLK